MAAIKYTAHSLSLSLSQSRSQSQSLIPNHSLGLLQTPPPTLPLRGVESREILSSSTCLAIKMLHASSAWRAESVSPAESRRDFNCSVRPQMSFTFELRQRGRAFCGSCWMGRNAGGGGLISRQGRQLASCHAHRHLLASTSVPFALA